MNFIEDEKTKICFFIVLFVIFLLIFFGGGQTLIGYLYCLKMLMVKLKTTVPRR